MLKCDLLSQFIEITLRHGCSPVNKLHIFRTTFFKNISGRLLLSYIFIPLWLPKLKISGTKQQTLPSFCIFFLENVENKVLKNVGLLCRGKHYFKNDALTTLWGLANRTNINVKLTVSKKHANEIAVNKEELYT